MIVPNEITETLGEQSGHKAAELQVLPELAGLCPLSPFFLSMHIPIQCAMPLYFVTNESLF